MRKLLWLLPVLAYLLTGITQIGPEERAVVRRFGKVVAQPGPGLHIGWPWGIDRVDRIPLLKVRQLYVGMPNERNTAELTSDPRGEFLTGDQNLINVGLVVEYTVQEAGTHLEDYLLNQASVDLILTREAENLTSEWASRLLVDQVLSGRTDLTRWLFAELPRRLETYQLGIAVQRVSVELLAAPVEVRDSFEAVNQAQTNVQTRKNQAEREAERMRAEARALKAQLENEASAYALEKKRIAQSEADTFVQRLERSAPLRSANPDFLAVIWRDEMLKLIARIQLGGKIEPLDDILGAGGIDLNQYFPLRKRPGQ
jgi:membrane protease subunit HflK